MNCPAANHDIVPPLRKKKTEKERKKTRECKMKENHKHLTIQPPGPHPYPTGNIARSKKGKKETVKTEQNLSSKQPE